MNEDNQDDNGSPSLGSLSGNSDAGNEIGDHEAGDNQVNDDEFNDDEATPHEGNDAEEQCQHQAHVLGPCGNTICRRHAAILARQIQIKDENIEILEERLKAAKEESRRLRLAQKAHEPHTKRVSIYNS